MPRPPALSRRSADEVSPVQLRLINELLIDLDVPSAARRTGLSPSAAYRMLEFPHVSSALQRAYAERSARVEVEADHVLRRWVDLMDADPREIVGIHLVACRHCWGTDHLYQMTDVEHKIARARHLYEQMRKPEQDRVEFDDQGGPGYTINKDPCRGPDWVKAEARRYTGTGISSPADLLKPNSDHSCPQCFGGGERHPWIADTRHLSPGAALLYNGYKITKDGSLQIMMRDRSHAEHMVAQHLGMLVQRSVNMNLDPSQLGKEQLEQVYEKFKYLLETDPDGQVIEHEGIASGSSSNGEVKGK